MRTLGNLLLLHDAELARLTQENGMGRAPKANRFWTKKTEELPQQVQEYLHSLYRKSKAKQ